MTSVDSNFNFLCGRPHGAGPLPFPVHLRPPEPDPLPLCVDVINGWPHMIALTVRPCKKQRTWALDKYM